MPEQRNVIERAWVTNWESGAVYGVSWQTADGLSGAFAAGRKKDAEEIAKELVGADPSSLAARYGRTMQRAAEAAQEHRRRNLLGLDHLDRVLKDFAKRQR